MQDRVKEVRIIATARALIVSDGKLLLVSNDKILWYVPGGWVDGFESLNETCEREIFEELGMNIEVGDIVKVCHYKVIAEENAPYFENVNKIEHYFLCKAITMPTLDGENNIWIDADSGLVKHAKWFEIAHLKSAYEKYNIQPSWIKDFQNNKIFEI